MELTLEGRSALVTGASRGIGREIALAFAAHGAAVTAVARSAADLETLAAEPTTQGRIRPVAFDALDLSGIETLVAQAEAHSGPPSVLVNAAGGAGTYIEGGNGGLLEVPAGAVDDLFALNVVAPYALTQAVARRMVAAGTGSIINITSRLASTPNPAVGAYCAAKSALASFTVTWAQELGPHGIRVNAIAPGGVATGNMDRILNDPALHADFLSTVPLGRLGEPRDAANCALFLASDASSWVSGATILLSGGRP